MSDVILEFRQVGRVFTETAEPVTLFQGLDWSLNRGDSVAIMGESGTGKSTLLHLAAALDQPTSGSVWLEGQEISRMGEKALSPLRTRSVGLVFQFHFLLKEFSVLENVLLPSWLAGTPKKAATERALALLERVGLSHRLGHFPGQLSGGERQRAALARALINDPPLLLADEPTGNLDEKNAELVQNLLLELSADAKKTLLLVTHDRSFAARAGYCLHLRGGQLVRP